MIDPFFCTTRNLFGRKSGSCPCESSRSVWAASARLIAVPSVVRCHIEQLERYPTLNKTGYPYTTRRLQNRWHSVDSTWLPPLTGGRPRPDCSRSHPRWGGGGESPHADEVARGRHQIHR